MQLARLLRKIAPLLGPAVLTALCLTAAQPAQAAYTYTTIAPFSSTQVAVNAVNASGQAAGQYVDPNTNSQFGFVTGANGSGATKIDPFGSFVVTVTGVNASGQVVGYYSDPNNNNQYGFVTGANGAGATKIDPAGSVNVTVTGVNASGQVVGYYIDSSNNQIGFLTGANGSGATTIDPYASTNVYVHGVNDSGQVAGDYVDSSFNRHGFLTGANGANASTPTIIAPTGDTNIQVSGVNATGHVVATSQNSSGNTVGFLTGANGSGATTVDPFSSIFTFSNGVNASGQVVGYYDDTSNNQLGFVTGANGSGATELDPFTSMVVFVQGINDSGQAAGYYYDSSGHQIGFLATPVIIPTITSLSPNSAAAGSGTFTLTINGTNFLGTTTAAFNGTALAITGRTATQLAATVPASLLMTAGPFPVTVTNPGPGGGTATATFTVNPANHSPVTLYAASYQNAYFFLTDSASQESVLLAKGWVGGPTGAVYANPGDAAGTTPLFQLFYPSTQDHFYTTDPNQRASLLAAGWQDNGVRCYVYTTQVSGTVPLYKAYNPQTGQHLFTADAEFYALLSSPWGKYGPAAYILPPPSAPQPAVALYSVGYQNMLFMLTDDPSLYASVTASGWVGGITGHVYANPGDAPGIVPLYRLFYPSTSDHFYTTSSSQRASLIAAGWQDKGISCYVYGTQVSGTVPLFKAYDSSTSEHLFTGDPEFYGLLSPPWGTYGPAAYILP